MVIVGNYGSGKTEVAVNLAVYLKQQGHNVSIADLDLVNPYFRTREARDTLRNFGIDVILPPDRYLNADLPILDPAVSGMIRRQNMVNIVDVGGDDAGATVLASLAESFRKTGFQMLQVINPFRPFTETIAGCLKIKSEIEAASKMQITGFIGNANLIDDTAVEHILDGYSFMSNLSKQSGLPLIFITINADLLMETQGISCPILLLRRQLVPPWKKPAAFSE